jgi:hypothetical protein
VPPHITGRQDDGTELRPNNDGRQPDGQATDIPRIGILAQDRQSDQDGAKLMPEQRTTCTRCSLRFVALLRSATLDLNQA